ncbi:hypothetical protein [Shinella sp. M31]|uniref:hypothetical protein n=1 Tax=Shinella sp. M31 TaxID=3368615 RepID=UPI003BA0F6B6
MGAGQIDMAKMDTYRQAVGNPFSDRMAEELEADAGEDKLAAEIAAKASAEPADLPLDIEQGVDPFDGFKRHRRDRRGVLSNPMSALRSKGISQFCSSQAFGASRRRSSDQS